MSVIDHAISKISTLLGINTVSASSALAAILDSREQERIAQVRRWWNFYNGQHYDYARQDGEMPYMNVCYAFPEKSVAWLVGTPPKLKAREDIHPIIEELYQEILENSGGDRFWTECVQMGSVSGDVVVRVGYDPDVNHERGGIMLQVMDSERTFWEYRNVGQRRKLTRVMTIWDELDPETGELKTYSEVWSDDEVRVYPPGRVLSVRNVAAFVEHEPQPNVLMDADGNEYSVYENPYGELPFVHIPNLLISQNVHGRSDLHDLWVLNKEFDEQMLSYKDNVDYHGNPLTLMYGISSRDVEKGAHKVWGNLPKDGRVENLEVTQTHEQILRYMELIKEGMGYAAVPVHLTGVNEQVQTETSAAAMRLAFLPLVELTQRKRVTYGKGFKSIFEMALRFSNMAHGLGLDGLDAPSPRLQEKLESEEFRMLPKDFKDRLLALRERPFYWTTVEFQEHLPRNRALELADLEVEIRNRLESIPGALRRLGVQDIEGKLEELLDSAEFLAQIEAMLVEASQPPMEEADGVPPETQPAEQQATSNGGRGNKKTPKNANVVEGETGQSADRTQVQRSQKGRGDN